MVTERILALMTFPCVASAHGVIAQMPRTGTSRAPAPAFVVCENVRSPILRILGFLALIRSTLKFTGFRVKCVCLYLHSFINRRTPALGLNKGLLNIQVVMLIILVTPIYDFGCSGQLLVLHSRNHKWPGCCNRILFCLL